MSKVRNRWVTKTDLMRYVRCPYAFWLLHTSRLSFAQTVTPLQVGLLEAGVAFQGVVEAKANPVVVDDVAALFSAEDQTIWLSALPPLMNEELGYRGLPDGVHTAGGALIPIETKSHRDVQPTDALELAFYWSLLEPYRSRPSEPRGVLVLRRDGAPVEVEVDLLPRHFDEVARIAAEVRWAREYGVAARMCTCTVCAGPMRDEVLRQVHVAKDLTLLWGVGPVSARAMEALGVNTYTDLLAFDRVELVATLRADKRSISASMIEAWCRHAESYTLAEAVLFGSPPSVPRSFIALDLEYVSGANTWLTGVCIIDGDEREIVQLWADTLADERRSLRQLAHIVAEHPSLPLLTWNGTGADVPQLRRTAGGGSKLAGLVDSIVASHLDLYLYAKRAVRLPIPSLALGDVAAYFGFAKLSPVGDGLEAQMRYLSYCQATGAARNVLREELLEYNRDDLAGLVAAAEGFRRLQLQPVATPAA